MIRRKILGCENLLGDSLYLLRPVKMYLDKYPEEVVALTAMPGISGEMFVNAFGNRLPVVFAESDAKAIDPDAEILKLDSGHAADLAFSNLASGGRQLHISEGYAALLGVDLDGQVDPIPDWQKHLGEKFENEYALLAPFSRSCMRHTHGIPNKTLDDWKWEPIIRFLRRHGYNRVVVTGAPGDRMKQVSIPESDYDNVATLEGIELLIKKAGVVISVDNGIAHLASSVGVNTLVLWPRVSSVEFIAPYWSPKTSILKIGNPNKAMPHQILVGIRKMLKALEDNVNG